MAQRNMLDSLNRVETFLTEQKSPVTKTAVKDSLKLKLSTVEKLLAYLMSRGLVLQDGNKYRWKW